MQERVLVRSLDTRGSSSQLTGIWLWGWGGRREGTDFLVGKAKVPEATNPQGPAPRLRPGLGTLSGGGAENRGHSQRGFPKDVHRDATCDCENPEVIKEFKELGTVRRAVRSQARVRGDPHSSHFKVSLSPDPGLSSTEPFIFITVCEDGSQPQVGAGIR